MTKNIFLLFVLFLFIQSAHAKIYYSEADDCLTRPEINGSLFVHLNSSRSGVFSHTNSCWWMASGDIKFQNYEGSLSAIARWVALKYIDYESDYEQYPKPDHLQPNSWVFGSLAFNYYVLSRDYFCQQSNTVCTELEKFTPQNTMRLKNLSAIHYYYNCYPTDTDYPEIGNANCKLDDKYYIENGVIKYCESNPSHPNCNKNTGSGSGNTGSGSGNTGNGSDNTGNGSDNTGNGSGNTGNGSGNTGNGSGNTGSGNESQLSAINDKLVVISQSLNITNGHVSKISTDVENISDSVDTIDLTLNSISQSVNESVYEQELTNNILGEISNTATGLLSESKSLRSAVNKNHRELINAIRGNSGNSDNGGNSDNSGNSGNSGIGDFTDSDADLLNNKFDNFADNYNDESLSFVENALSKLSNNIPDLALMFKLPSSFYGGNNGTCKPLSTNLNFKFPFSPQNFVLKFDMSNFCQNYDKNFRGIVDFLLAFMTALAIFRLYHRYNSSH